MPSRRFDDELGVERAACDPSRHGASFGEDAVSSGRTLSSRSGQLSLRACPIPRFVERVRATGAVVLSSATTVAEAVWLEAHGCDVVIAQGAEAGGHRGMFLTEDVAAQPGTIALVPTGGRRGGPAGDCRGRDR